MKRLHTLHALTVCGLFLLSLTACERDVTDFGFDGSISGTIKDQAGNIVPGTTTANALTVQVRGATDQVATVVRVKGDGTFQNTKLFPSQYRIWISGPATLVGDTVRVDLAAERVWMKDLVVVPFISVKPPVAAGSTATSVNVSFDMTANSGKTVATRELYCSTVPYPDASIGAGPGYDTKRVALTTNSGTATVTGLLSKTKYYIRIGAQATGVSSMNYSDQLTVTTP
ncbi:hypothetical protein ACFPMF_13225 [Larkinella bovis]|uniref:Fibronectin type-III domain-containing protein n=1 Tax=Larkinella bovis TaxID=683041 RepID=A0ABW0ID16_9BACT